MGIACVHIGLAWIPILTSLLLSLTLFICYLLAVKSGSTRADFPSISDVGNFPLESCIYGQVLNLAAGSSLVCGFIWYYIAEYRTHYMGSKQPITTLKVYLLFTCIYPFGMSIMGNFQVHNAESLHLLGMFLAGLGITVSILLMTYICRRHLGYRPIRWAPKLCFGIVCAILLIIGVVSKCETFFGNYESYKTATKALDWNMKVTTLMVIDSVVQWGFVVIFIAFLLSLVPEFDHSAMKMPQVISSSTLVAQ